MLGVEGEACSVTIPKGTHGVPSLHCLAAVLCQSRSGGQLSPEGCPQPGLRGSEPAGDGSVLAAQLLA